MQLAFPAVCVPVGYVWNGDACDGEQGSRLRDFHAKDWKTERAKGRGVAGC